MGITTAIFAEVAEGRRSRHDEDWAGRESGLEAGADAGSGRVAVSTHSLSLSLARRRGGGAGEDSFEGDIDEPVFTYMTSFFGTINGTAMA